MFHTILTLSYLTPNLYLFIRIWQLFIPGRYRLWYILIYALFFSVYPLTSLFDNSDGGTALYILNAVANYLLPCFLYLFLFVLLADILLLINLLIRVISSEKLSGETFRIKALIIIICLSVTVVIAGIINFNTIRTSEYQVVTGKEASDIDRLRIAFVSDFHLEERTPVKFVERFIKKIKAIDPDLILYGGDIVEGFGEVEKMEHFEVLFRRIKTKYGAYGVPGNHDSNSGLELWDFFGRAGIKILRDTFVLEDRSFIIAGRNDSRARARNSAEELMGSIPVSLPVILMDHRPTEMVQISKTSADIVFSGHTHDGQLFPINLITRRVYELSHGYLKKGSTHFFVSSGIRLWGPPVRTSGRSEIMVVDVTFK